MKMKKIILLFSMIAVLFSVTGCSDGQEKVDFEYTSTDIITNTLYQSYQFQNASDAYRAYLADSEDEMATALLTAVSNFDTVEEECGEFVGYCSKDGDSILFDFNSLNAQDEESYYAAIEALSEFISLVDATVEEEGNTVVVTIPVVYANRDAEYTFIYENNPAYAYAQELYSQSVNPYQIKEVTASPNYTFGEKMGKAGANTLMGMGTVFVVLLFIAFLIGQFERLAKVITSVSDKVGAFVSSIKNKNKKEMLDEEPVAMGTAPVVPVTVNPMDDAQLVAVITAAVVAANTAAGGSDKLVVRSIRKAKR